MVSASERVRELLERIPAGVGVDSWPWVSQDLPRLLVPERGRYGIIGSSVGLRGSRVWRA